MTEPLFQVCFEDTLRELSIAYQSEDGKRVSRNISLVPLVHSPLFGIRSNDRDLLTSAPKPKRRKKKRKIRPSRKGESGTVLGKWKPLSLEQLALNQLITSLLPQIKKLCLSISTRRCCANISEKPLRCSIETVNFVSELSNGRRILQRFRSSHCSAYFLTFTNRMHKLFS